MKIQYASDLHLEKSHNKTFAKNNPIIVPSADTLILAGDIMSLDNFNDNFLSWCSDNFKATYWVPGNHEYYGADVLSVGSSINDAVYSNVFLVNNVAVFIEDVTLVFSTMWTKISVQNSWELGRNFNDFHYIEYGNKKLTVDNYNALHDQSMKFLNYQLDNIKPKTIFATHHCPTYKAINPVYKGDIFNEMFHVEVGISTSAPEYWIYGHNHYNMEEVELFNTKFVTNQLGYISDGENVNFLNNKIIEI
jgi:predicted phosphohydrolase